MPSPPAINHHDAEFFEQMRACRDPYRRLADAIHAIVGPQKTALDIGCGIGLQTRRLLELGWGITGAEYAPAALERLEPGVKVKPFDLTVPLGARASVISSKTPRACVICTETAEHLPKESADVIVQNICSLARDVIVWSAAAPGQEWPGHINLQPPSYWLKRFQARGWVLDEARTGALRDHMLKTEAQHWRGRENFCVLVPKKAYRPLHFTITSTCLNAEAYIARCMQSVNRQTYPHWSHLIIDAASTDKTFDIARRNLTHGKTDVRRNATERRLGPLENAYNLWKKLPDDEVIVWLDGDDWLATDHALDILARTYASPLDPWVTYGQFMFATGEIGFAGEYPPGENARDSDWWRATHLKTFRAGLVKQLDPKLFLNPQGKFCDLAIDRAVMYPLLELAGEHRTYIDRILYVYNSKASWWASQPESERQRELDEVARLRAAARLAPLKKRPW